MGKLEEKRLLCIEWGMRYIVENKDVADMSGGANIIMLLKVALAVSFIFSAVFLFYTNSFLMKRRTKEIGL